MYLIRRILVYYKKNTDVKGANIWKKVKMDAIKFAILRIYSIAGENKRNTISRHNGLYTI